MEVSLSSTKCQNAAGAGKELLFNSVVFVQENSLAVCYSKYCISRTISHTFFHPLAGFAAYIQVRLI